MSIFSSGMNKLKELNAAIRARRISKLLGDTSRIEKKFLLEAKALGIDVQHINLKSHYDVLGIKYTNDPKAIKDAYIRLVKQYHPDVSHDPRATQKTVEINQAYGVLKDRDRKLDYDSQFSKGSNRMSLETTKILYRQLLSRYQAVRQKDFEEFNKRVATPQEINNLKATIADVTNWNRRFSQVSSGMFGNFRDYGAKLGRLDAANRSLLKAHGNQADINKLQDNLDRLDGLVEAFKETDSGIKAVIERVISDIETEENNLSDRLRRSIS